MKTSNAAFATFIDEKYMPLAPRVKLGIVVGLVVLPLVVFYFSYYQQKAQIVKNLNQQKITITNQLKEVQIKTGNLAQFEKEMQEAEAKFLESAALLPKEKEIPKLLKDISALGRNAGLDFLTFKPSADIPKDFYAEIPVTINVRGPYHNMGFFFDQVSKLERIVSVSNVKMSSPKKEGGEMLLNSDCQLVTYRFTNVELPKPPKK